MTNPDYRIYTVPNMPRFIFVSMRRDLTSSELQQAMGEAKQLCPQRTILIHRADGSWTSLAHQNLLPRGNDAQAGQAWDRAQDKATRGVTPTPRRILG
jgi:hypothetical protein